jgi:hypothetical protein
VGKTWTSPAYSNGVLFAKDATKLIAVKLTE